MSADDPESMQSQDGVDSVRHSGLSELVGSPSALANLK